MPIQAVMLRPPKDSRAAVAAKTSDDAKKDEPDEAATGGKTGETKECVFVVESGKAKLRAVKSGISDETSVAVARRPEGRRDRRDWALPRAARSEERRRRPREEGRRGQGRRGRREGSE